MANKRQTKGRAPARAQVQTRSVGMRVLAVVVAIVLIAAAALVVLQFCTPYKPSGWFDKASKEEPANGGYFDLSELDSNDIALLSEDIDFADYELYGVSTYAMNAKILTAKIDNIDATRLFDWTVRWKNENSTWAKGKQIAMYVRVTVSQETTERAVVECDAAFSEPVIIEVKLKANPNARASVEGNYVKQLESATVGFSTGVVNIGSNEACAVTVTNPVYSMGGQGTVEPELVCGVYNESVQQKCTLTISEEFASALGSYGVGANTYQMQPGAPSVTSKLYVLTALGYNSAPESYQKQGYAAFITAAEECSVHAVLTVEVSAYYKGKLLLTKEFTANVVFNVDALKSELDDLNVEIEGEVWFG